MDGEWNGGSRYAWEKLTFEHELIQKDYVLEQMLCITKRYNIPVMMGWFEHRVNGEAHASIGNPYIVLSNRMNSNEMRFVFGHEIGHIFLHSGSGGMEKPLNNEQQRHPREIKADNFAKNLIAILEKKEWVIPRPEQCSPVIERPMVKGQNDGFGGDKDKDRQLDKLEQKIRYVV